MTKPVLVGLGVLAILVGAAVLLRPGSGPQGCTTACPLCHGRGLILTPDEELPARPCPGPVA